MNTFTPIFLHTYKYHVTLRIKKITYTVYNTDYITHIHMKAVKLGCVKIRESLTDPKYKERHPDTSRPLPAASLPWRVAQCTALAQHAQGPGSRPQSEISYQPTAEPLPPALCTPLLT